MKKTLFVSVKLSVMIMLIMAIGCQELPTSIQNSSMERTNSENLDSKNTISKQLNHFTTAKDMENDKLLHFSVNNIFDLNIDSQDGLEYHWDFNGDGEWDTEWNSQKTVNFTFDDYQEYSTRLEIKDNVTVLADVEQQVAIEPACVDVDGNFYQIVKIGKQWWMAENLKVKHYRNREPVKNVTIKSEWSRLNSPAYSYWLNNTAIPIEYGLLYNWRAVNDQRGIAPNGWHVPTDAEIQTLVNYLGGDRVAGGKMKEKGNNHWYHPNKASNSSGFTALPGGHRASDGDFHGFGGFGFLWTSTPAENSRAWYIYMDHIDYEIVSANCSKRYGFSIRCVKDSK